MRDGDRLRGRGLRERGRREQDALTEFGKANGIDIKYVGRRDFEQQINVQVLGGNPPDIANFPQPGKLAQFA